MAVPEIVYATFAGSLDQQCLARLMYNLATPTTQGAKAVHLLFQSTGGVISDGISLYNYFRAYPIELHLYNTGAVQSIAVTAYLGAKQRYTSAHASFLIHKSAYPAQLGCTLAKARILVEALASEDARTEAILKAETTIPQSVWERHATQDVLFNAAEALQFGIATAEREWQVPAGNQIFNI